MYYFICLHNSNSWVPHEIPKSATVFFFFTKINADNLRTFYCSNKINEHRDPRMVVGIVINDKLHVSKTVLTAIVV